MYPSGQIGTGIIVVILALASLSGFAEEKEVDRPETHFNLGKGGLAINGYDPVAYFNEGGGKATAGEESITHTIGKTTYRFATEANRERFKADPVKYEPAYGGWCAYAMGAKGEKVEINPEAFVITDGQLFLFYKTFLTDTRKPWNKDSSLQPKADRSWAAITKDTSEAKSGE